MKQYITAINYRKPASPPYKSDSQMNADLS